MAMPRACSFCLFAFCFLSLSVLEASGLKAKRGDDDGDAGGLGGALAGLFGAAGGSAGGDGASDDDDPNMVGKKKKGAGGKGGTGGIDVEGAEKAMQGGAGNLISMLKAMRAAQGSGSGAKIIKKKNGEEMYDFRDLDDGITTTEMPTKIEQPTFSPLVAAAMAKSNQVEVPSMPSLGKGGMLSAEAMEQIAATAAKVSSQAQAVPATALAGNHLIAWPPATSPVATVAAAPQVYQPFVPVAQASIASAATAASTQGLFQGMAALRANMDALMSQAAVGGGGVLSAPPNGAGEKALEAKIDQMSESFASEEHKMESKMGTIESENNDLSKQLQEQATEIKAVENGKPIKALEITKPITAVLNAQPAKAVQQAKPVKAVQQAKPIKAVEQAKPIKAVVEAKPVKAVEEAKPVKAVEEAKPVKAVVEEAKPVSLTKGTASVTVHTAAVANTSTYATKPWDATFRVHLDGHAGGKEATFSVRVHPEWAPEGAKRFQDMVQSGILNDARFFRVIPGFMVQWGIPGDPKVAATWLKKKIQDDAVIKSNTRGMMSFATSGPNTRTTQMFINYADNKFLDKQGFSPFAEVLGKGMTVVSKIQSKYKERPKQGKLQHLGNKYLNKHFPKLSFIGHVDSTLPSPVKGAGLLQASASAQTDQSTGQRMGQAEMDKKFRRSGVPTFSHQKKPQGN